MSAVEVYWRAVSSGNIPAAVPIIDDGDAGLGAVVFEPTSAALVNMALSSDDTDRAILAIQACKAAREVISTLPGVTTA